MQSRFWVSKFSILFLVLVGSMAGQGWGQTLPFAIGTVSADHLSAPVSDDDALVPEAARLVALLKSVEIDPPADILAGWMRPVSVLLFGDGYPADRSDAPLVHIRTMVTSAPRAPPTA